MSAPDDVAADWASGLAVLAHDNYIAVNRTLIQIVGLNAAVLVCELSSEARYWFGRGELKDGWFFSSISNVKKYCGLSKHCQAEAFKVLKEKEMIEVEYKGLPRTRYIRVNAQRILALIDEEERKSIPSPASGAEIGPLAVQELVVNKRDIYTGIDRVTSKEESQVDSSSKEDSLDSSGGDQQEIEAVIDYLNSKVGGRYTYRNKKTNSLIRARLSDGFTVDDFKKVVDVKAAAWLGTDMATYLRPSTLFAPGHFEEYLNEVPKRGGKTRDYSEWDQYF